MKKILTFIPHALAKKRMRPILASAATLVVAALFAGALFTHIHPAKASPTLVADPVTAGSDDEAAVSGSIAIEAQMLQEAAAQTAAAQAATAHSTDQYTGMSTNGATNGVNGASGVNGVNGASGGGVLNTPLSTIQSTSQATAQNGRVAFDYGISTAQGSDINLMPLQHDQKVPFNMDVVLNGDPSWLVNGGFCAPKAGWYHVTGRVVYASVPVSCQVGEFLVINGDTTHWVNMSWVPGASGHGEWLLTGGYDVYLNVGDIVQLYGYFASCGVSNQYVYVQPSSEWGTNHNTTLSGYMIDDSSSLLAPQGDISMGNYTNGPQP